MTTRVEPDGELVKTIGVDFDGVIHQYPRWCPVGQAPVAGALDALRTLMKSYAVFIFCARTFDDGNRGGLRDIPDWFAWHGFEYPVICDLASTEGHFWTTRNVLLVTNRKIPALAYIDDRGIRFTSWAQTMSDLKLYYGNKSGNEPQTKEEL